MKIEKYGKRFECKFRKKRKRSEKEVDGGKIKEQIIMVKK